MCLAGLFAGLLVLSAVEQEDAPATSAQDDLLVENWQTDAGLPRNTVNSLVQDKQGYLWISTPYGLVRFDGVRFEELKAEGLPAFRRQAGSKLLCDRDGAIWFSPDRSGPYRLRDGVVSPALDPGQLTGRWGESIQQDKDGVIWMVDATGRFGRIEAGQFKTTANLGDLATGPMLFQLCTDAAGQLWFYKQSVYGQIVNGQPTNYMRVADAVVQMVPSRDGGMWLSTGRDLRLIPPGGSVSATHVCDLPFGPYGISTMLEDRSGMLWLGTLRDGVYRLEAKTLKKVAGTHHHVRDLLEDAEGNMWVATDGAGLFKIRPRVFQIRGVAAGLPHATVTSVSGDWVAPTGGGLGQIQPSGLIKMLPEHTDNSVTAVIEDGSGGAWIGTAGGRLIHRLADGRVTKPDLLVWPAGTQVRVLLLDGKENLWVGGYPFGLFLLPAGTSGGLTPIEMHPELSRMTVTAMAEDQEEALWIGTAGGELVRYKDGQSQTCKVGNESAAFPVGALLVDRGGTLWVGTLGGGLGRFKDGKVDLLGKRAGLKDNVISQLAEDDFGSLWIGCSRGLARVRLAELTALADQRKSEISASHYGRSDGLSNVQCSEGSQPAAWKTRAGEMRFATSQGVVCFDPTALTVNLRPPPLILEAMLVDGVLVTNRNGLKLHHDFKKLEFRYNATSFVAPEKMMFKHRLVGFDEDWIFDDDNTRRAASYPWLPPGNYAFQFTACNNDGVWNDEIFTQRFVVVPAYWQTVWFRVGAAIVFAGMVGGAVLVVTRLRVRRKLARLEQANALERERSRISRDLHDDLGARLTQMALLTDMAADDPAAPADLKGQIKDVSTQARHAVQSLDETVWMINPQKDTLAHLIGYVARYAEQFFQPTTVTCLQEICPQPPECMMAGKLRRDILLLVKEALNNVLKHSKATEVRLRISVRRSVMRITVRDNGQGFTGTPNAQRHGLAGMQRRAESAGIKVTVRSQAGHGTLVALRIKLPLATHRPARAALRRNPQ